VSERTNEHACLEHAGTLLALYTNPESPMHSITDGQDDDANSQSHCVAVQLAKNCLLT